MVGVQAGAVDAEGIYSEGTVNRQVADRLADFVRKRRRFGAATQDENAKE